MTKKQKLLAWAIFISSVIVITLFLEFLGIRPAHGGQIQVRWNEATESDLKEYWIERKDKKRGRWSVVTRPAKDTSQTILMGVDGKGYWWRIRAVDESNNVGGPSNVVYYKFPKKKPGRQGLNYGAYVALMEGRT